MPRSCDVVQKDVETPENALKPVSRYPRFRESDSHRPAPCMLPVGKRLFELTILSAAKVEVAAGIAG